MKQAGEAQQSSKKYSDLKPDFRLHARRAATGIVRFGPAYALASAIIAAPIATERAVEDVSFEDRLGDIPVEVSLSHNNHSTLDGGILGQTYLDQTGPFGFGATLRGTDPPEAGGTLASFVDPNLLKRNLAVVGDPESVIEAYADKFKEDISSNLLRNELLVACLGGLCLGAMRGQNEKRYQFKQRLGISTVAVLGATSLSCAYTVHEFREWTETQEITESYPIPDVDGVSVSSPVLLEIAQQVTPFIEKNKKRSREAATAYKETAEQSLAEQLAAHAEEITPRSNETLVIAEADPQGSYVGTAVRTMMYEKLQEVLGSDSISLRTIAGDITSNGTIAEADFVEKEAKVSGEIPTAAVGGDHDSEETWQQMQDNDMIVLDNQTTGINGLNVAGSNDRNHKTLFGGMVTNDSGISETELGAALRQEIPDDQVTTVLLHQPAAAAGYIGADSLSSIQTKAAESYTTPYDDGVADLPPGSIDIGHLHDASGPWVIWNTDTDVPTWTVVDQLGTAGGVEENPTYNRFSTPDSAPLKDISVRVKIMDTSTGLQTGFATISFDTKGMCTITKRTDVGMPITSSFIDVLSRTNTTTDEKAKDNNGEAKK